MLPRLTIGFIALTSAVAIAACSSFGNTSNLNVGPNFPSMTLYATNSNQDAISIFNQGQKTGTGPSYEIGGSSTTLNGPQYIAFDSGSNLWVTNYNPSTNASLLIEIEALATGDVLPLLSTAQVGHLRGIAITPKNTAVSKGTLMVISDVIPTQQYPSQLLLFTEGATTPYQSIAGPNPALEVPGGVALDTKNNIYVANLQGAKVQKFILPTPSPTPSGSPSPTPSPSPSPSTSPSGSPSPTPSPSPTASPINIKPTFTIAGPKTGLVTPTSVTVDTNGNVFVTDIGSPSGPQCPASIFVFHPGGLRGNIDQAPLRKISGCATKLSQPTDIKVNATTSLLYVADGTQILVFKTTDGGNVAPQAYYTSKGAITGLGLVP
jgi:hypothetical protein